MSFAHEPGTHAYYATNPFLVARRVDHVPTARVAEACRKFVASVRKPLPQADAQAGKFYLWHHAVSELRARRPAVARLAPEEKDLLDRYATWLARKAAPRVFYYLVMICTREARHAHSTLDAVGSVLRDFFTQVCKRNEHQAVEFFKTHPPDATIGEYARALSLLFYKASFQGGFGGPKWGAVADALVRFVEGQTSAEALCDAVWALCHNNGPIFNKGMLYAGNGSKLIEVLDVQRAGMVPHYFAEGRITAGDDFHYLASVLGWSDDMKVDWKRVEELGAVGRYVPHAKTKPKADPNDPLAQAKKLWENVGPNHPHVFVPMHGLAVPKVAAPKGRKVA